MVRISLIIFILASCSLNNSGKIGYHEDDKPYKGTRFETRDYVKPYWQCVQFNRNVNCDNLE